MQSGKKIASVDEIVDKLNLDREVEDEYEFDAVTRALEELESVAMIDRNLNLNDDTVFYGARHGLKWSEFHNIDDPIKKTILLMLVENPKTFFVLQNTQSGKTNICIKEINKWAECKDIKPVVFVITQNDRTLTDQLVTGLTEKCVNCELFKLSSSSGQTFKQIDTHIDAYSADTVGKHKMPIITALANGTQNNKILKLMSNILQNVRYNQSKLRYGIIFDEADDTYPKLRKMRIDVDGVSMCYSQFIVDNDDALHRIGFVSATEGDLLDEDYPECANAYLYPVDSDNSNPNYRAAHHSESEFRIEKMPSKMSSNSYAEKLISENLEYFTTPIAGTNYYRKIIINSNTKSSDMISIAKFANSCGINAMVFNMFGVKTYIPGNSGKTFKIRGRKFNELLFEMYKTNNMENKPLVIIGRRKVDRGLGFHYAPRDGSEGLIWTDMILGRIEDVNTAVQKAGRLAGIISQCPQYYGKCTYWTDERTRRDILHHNNKVDEANKTTGCTVLQAVTRANVKVNENVIENETPPPPPPKPKPTPKPKADPNDFDHIICDSQEEGIAYAKDTFNVSLRRRTNEVAPEELRCDGENPTLEYIQQRKWGLSDKSKVRMCVTKDNKWVVYWRPSKI